MSPDPSSSRLLKSFGSFGRAKDVSDRPVPQAPSDMSERLARLRQSALAAEAPQPRAHPQEPDLHGAGGAGSEYGEAAEQAYSPLEHHEPERTVGIDLRALALEPMSSPQSVSLQSDAIAWLAETTPEIWHYVASQWDWDWGVEPLAWIAQQQECDAGTAAMLFWKSGEAEDYLPFGDAEPTEDEDLMVADMEEHIAGRFERDEFGPMRFAFDERLVLPHFPSRLEKLYMEERMDWDAHKVPRRSSGEMVLIDRFDHETEAEINNFLKAMKAE